MPRRVDICFTFFFCETDICFTIVYNPLNSDVNMCLVMRLDCFVCQTTVAKQTRPESRPPDAHRKPAAVWRGVKAKKAAYRVKFSNLLLFAPLPLAGKSLFSSRKVNPKSATVSVTSNLAVHAWSTKCRRNKKLITQFSCKSRDKSFEPN
jgi:hypothetical protein